MNILVVGSGGREHALIWKLKQSAQAEKIYCAPGNGGIALDAECVDISVADIPALVKFAKEHEIGLTIVGPEQPLVEGIVDAFEQEGLLVFGPSQAAAQLEGSKVFSKEFMRSYGIPTAEFQVFDDIRNAAEFIKKVEYPVVIKADGLAAGKGVVICKNYEEAEGAIRNMMVDKVFSEAGSQIVIEECLEGEEVSILAISDGENYIILDSSQDHKRIFDDDLGPNTGGMGAYSPAPIMTADLFDEVDETVIQPTIKGMSDEGAPFKGILYAGLMITEDGPKVLEYNVRFGDPEAQAILPRLKNDLVELFHAAVEGRLDTVDLVWDKRDCVCVVISSGGYPKEYETGHEIKGLEDVKSAPDTVVFHAGTKKDGDKIVTSGGRVLGVTALGNGIDAAIKTVYQSVEKISFKRSFFRRDIGAKAFKHIKIARM